MKSDSTIFFREFLEVVECYQLETDQLNFLKIILKYGLGDDKITTEKVPQKFKPAFISIKSIIDKTTEKYKSMTAKRTEAGKKGADVRWHGKTNYTQEEEQKFLQIMSDWNSIELTQVKRLTDERKNNINMILQKYSTEDFAKVFNEIRASDFLKGKNADMWSVSFDWIIKDEQNFTKVLEGTYKTRSKETTKEISEIWK